MAKKSICPLDANTVEATSVPITGFRRCTTAQETTSTIEAPQVARDSHLQDTVILRLKEQEHLGIFGKNEIRDLAIGLGIIILILFSSTWRILMQQGPLFLIGALLIYGLAFILHELAHKFMAQRLGYWAEFKINQQGIMLTLLSLISPFKIIAPGAVMIGNIASWDHYGKVSIAGPATNIGMGMIYFLVALITGNPMVNLLALIGMNINASLASST